MTYLEQIESRLSQKAWKAEDFWHVYEISRQKMLDISKKDPKYLAAGNRVLLLAIIGFAVSRGADRADYTYLSSFYGYALHDVCTHLLGKDYETMCRLSFRRDLLGPEAEVYSDSDLKIVLELLDELDKAARRPKPARKCSNEWPDPRTIEEWFETRTPHSTTGRLKAAALWQ